MNHLLHGDVGYQQVEVNAQGRVIRVLGPYCTESRVRIFI